MLPLFKVVSLIFRVFSKPLISYTKTYHATNQIKSNRLRVFFIMLGNKYHKFQNFINRRYLKVGSQFAYKPLNDNLALQKGIEFFYQIVFYLIVLGFPITQLYLASVQSKQKSDALNTRLKNIDNKSKQLKQKIQSLVALKKANQKVEQNIVKYSLKNIPFLPLDKNQNFCIQNPIRLYVGSHILKQFKYCIAS